MASAQSIDVFGSAVLLIDETQANSVGLPRQAQCHLPEVQEFNKRYV